MQCNHKSHVESQCWSVFDFPSQIEGLGLYVVYIVYHAIRIKKNINILPKPIEIIEIKS